MRVGKNKPNVWTRNNIKDSRQDFSRKEENVVFYLKITFTLANHTFYNLRYIHI